jgi:hypothetical protein
MTSTLSIHADVGYADPADPETIPRAPTTEAEALAFAYWAGRSDSKHYRSDCPEDLARELRNETAMARIAYDAVQRDLSWNDPDQLSALLDACEILANAVAQAADNFERLQGVGDAERLLGRWVYSAACVAAHSGHRLTLEEAQARAAQNEREYQDFTSEHGEEPADA